MKPPMTLAPIALFAYRRPDHLQSTLTSLQLCPGFLDAPLYIFCDGPRDQHDQAGCARVRQLLNQLPHPNKQLFVSPVNRGLASSLMTGIDFVLERHETVIVIEDDLLLAPHFLSFINAGLQAYWHRTDVMQVSGHMYPVSLHGPHDALLLPMATSWGWGTWRRAWQHMDRELASFEPLRRQPAAVHRFDLEGAYPYFSLLQKQVQGRIDSWFIRWYLTIFTHGGLVIYPRHSLVRNTGFDGTGVHCGAGGSPYDAVGSMPPPGPLLQEFSFPDHADIDQMELTKVQDFLRARNTFLQRARRRMITTTVQLRRQACGHMERLFQT